MEINFCWGKKKILPSSEAGYLKMENTGQNMNVTKRVVEGLWKKNLWKWILMYGQR